MKNGPFADVFPVENGDILSLCQFTRGYVVLNTLRANLAGIFSVLLITRAKLAGISLLQTQVAVSQTWLFFTPPPQKKKKHWGRFHPSEKKKKPDYKFNTFCTRVGSKIVFSWWYIPVEFVSEKKNCRFFNLPAKTSCYECSSTLLLKPAIQLPKKNGREFLCSAGSSASRTLRNQGSAVTMPGSCMEQSRSCGDCRASSGVINRCLMNIFGSWNLLMVQEIR